MTSAAANDDALARTVIAILSARGHDGVARLLEGAGLHLLPGGDTWTIGGREVQAESFALALAPAAFVAFERITEATPAVTEALRDAVQGPSVALKDLFVLVALSPADGAWSAGYRRAAQHVEPPPSVESVRATASVYLRARGLARAEAILEAAALDRTRMPSASAPALYRYVLALAAADLAETDRDAALRDVIVGAVELAARRATERAASVELALRSVLR